MVEQLDLFEQRLIHCDEITDFYGWERGYPDLSWVEVYEYVTKVRKYKQGDTFKLTNALGMFYECEIKLVGGFDPRIVLNVKLGEGVTTLSHGGPKNSEGKDYYRYGRTA